MTRLEPICSGSLVPLIQVPSKYRSLLLVAAAHNILKKIRNLKFYDLYPSLISIVMMKKDGVGGTRSNMGLTERACTTNPVNMTPDLAEDGSKDQAEVEPVLTP